MLVSWTIPSIYQYQILKKVLKRNGQKTKQPQKTTDKTVDGQWSTKATGKQGREKKRACERSLHVVS